jgi:CheY-like chemotaxis protein
MGTLFVLDDDSVFHRIIEFAHSKSSPYKNIYHYYEAKHLINYIWTHRNDNANLPDVIFVDINMPIIDGWAFLDAYDRIYPTLCKKATVYITTVSVMAKDKAKAVSYPFVEEYIVKPITTNKLKAIGQTMEDNLKAQL